MPRIVHWLLLGRYAILAALATLIPVPFVDAWIENLLRRRLTRAIARRRGATLDHTAVKALGNAPGGGCLGCLLSAVIWPIRKFLRTMLVVWQAKVMADTASDVIHRGLLLEEAFEQGWLPDGDAKAIREAMDRSLRAVSTKVVEGMLLSLFTRRRRELVRVFEEAFRAMRRLARAERAEEAVGDADPEPLGEHGERASSRLIDAVRDSSAYTELVERFRQEMGASPTAPLSEPVEE